MIRNKLFQVYKHKSCPNLYITFCNFLNIKMHNDMTADDPGISEVCNGVVRVLRRTRYFSYRNTDIHLETCISVCIYIYHEF